MYRLIFLFSLQSFCAALSGQSRVQEKLSYLGEAVLFREGEDGYLEFRFKENKTSGKEQNVRLTAIALNVSLGVFGMHRLYLGTDVKVPVFYTLTLGGGMILWIVDLGCLIFTKDISPYYDNPHVFMWNKP